MIINQFYWHFLETRTGPEVYVNISKPQCIAKYWRHDPLDRFKEPIVKYSTVIGCNCSTVQLRQLFDMNEHKSSVTQPVLQMSSWNLMLIDESFTNTVSVTSFPQHKTILVSYFICNKSSSWFVFQHGRVILIIVDKWL